MLAEKQEEKESLGREVESLQSRLSLLEVGGAWECRATGGGSLREVGGAWEFRATGGGSEGFGG